MNIKIWVTVVFILVAGIAGAQNNIVVSQKSYDREFKLDFYFDEGSNALNSKMISLLNYGGYIDNNLKETNLNRFGNNNIYGKNFDLNLSYCENNGKIFGIEQMGFQVAVEWHNLMELRFDEDLFKLVFYGNTSFAGSHANLSNTAFNYLNYYRLKGGLNKFSKNKFSYFGFNVSLNLGNNYSSAVFNNSSFYTSENGDSLALNGDLNFRYQSLSILPFSDINGYGAGIDLFYIYDNSQLFKIEAEIRNLGFIRWNKNSMEFSQKEPVIWQGLEIENLLEMPEPLMEKSGIDSLKEFISVHSVNAQYYSMTPADIKLKFSKMLNNGKVRGVAGLRYRFFGFFRPEVFLQSDFFIGKSLILSPVVSYGGWNGFNIGFKFEYKLGKFGKIQMGTNYITGMLLQNNFSGFGGFINFTYQI